MSFLSLEPKNNSGTVLDSSGNLLSPDDPAALQAILDSLETESVLSTLDISDDLPDDFLPFLGALDGGLTIDDPGLDFLGFGLVVDGTLDDLEADPDNTTVLLSTLDQGDISDIVAGDSFSLSFDDPSVDTTEALVFDVSLEPDDEVVNLQDPEDLQDVGTTIVIDDSVVEAIDLANLEIDVDGDGNVDDLTGQSLDINITLFREAEFDNLIGFFAVDAFGAINGITPTADNRIAFAQAAIDNSVAQFSGPANESTLDVTLQAAAGSVLLPFIISDSTTPNADFSNVFFPFIDLNTDGADHIRLLGQGVFGFEDLVGGGDEDFDDVIAQITSVEVA